VFLPGRQLAEWSRLRYGQFGRGLERARGPQKRRFEPQGAEGLAKFGKNCRERGVVFILLRAVQFTFKRTVAVWDRDPLVPVMAML